MVVVISIPNVQVRRSLYSSSTRLCLNTEGFLLAPSATLVHWDWCLADYRDSKSSSAWLLISTELLIFKVWANKLNRNAHCLLVPAQKHNPNFISYRSASLFTASSIPVNFLNHDFFFFQVTDKKMKLSEAKNKSLKTALKIILFDEDSETTVSCCQLLRFE